MASSGDANCVENTFPVPPGVTSDRVNADVLLDIVDVVVDGLLTDGGHHKQASLEEILRIIYGNVVFNQFKKDSKEAGWGWERGIP